MKLEVLKTLSSTGLEQSITKVRVTLASASLAIFLLLLSVLTGAYFVVITIYILYYYLILLLASLPLFSAPFFLSLLPFPFWAFQEFIISIIFDNIS